MSSTEMLDPSEIRKSILIIKSSPKALGSVEAFLRNRDWKILSTSDIKQALQMLVANKPSFVMIGVDHPNKKIRALPKLILQSFPTYVMAFTEGSSTGAYKALIECGAPYRINTPVTGPAVERTINKIIRDKEIERSRMEEAANQEEEEETYDADGDATTASEAEGGSLKPGGAAYVPSEDKAAPGLRNHGKTSVLGGGKPKGGAHRVDAPNEGNETDEGDATDLMSAIQSAIDSSKKMGAVDDAPVFGRDKKKRKGGGVLGGATETAADDDDEAPLARLNNDSKERGSMGKGTGSSFSGASNDPRSPGYFPDQQTPRGRGHAASSIADQINSQGGSGSSAKGRGSVTGGSSDVDASDAEGGWLDQDDSSGARRGRKKPKHSVAGGADQGSDDEDADPLIAAPSAMDTEDGTADSIQGRGPNRKRAKRDQPLVQYDESDIDDRAPGEVEGLGGSSQGKKMKPEAIGVTGKEGRAPQSMNAFGQDTHKVVSKSTGWAKSENIFVKGTQEALEESIRLGEGPPAKVKLEGSSNVACLVIESARFSGYLVAALGKNRRMDESFVATIRERLAKFLAKAGEDIADEQSMGLKIRAVDFEDWSVEYADFLRKSVHDGEEIAMAFFPFSEAKTKVEASAQADMGAVNLAELKGDVNVEFNVYVYLPANKKYVLYTPRGSKFYGSQKERLARMGVTHMHVKRTDLQEVSKYRAQNYLNSKIEEYEAKKKMKATAA